MKDDLHDDFHKSVDAKILNAVFALIFIALGLYCITQEGYSLPSRTTTAHNAIYPPNTYFVGSGLLLFGVTIIGSSFAELNNKKHVYTIGVLVAISILLFIFGR